MSEAPYPDMLPIEIAAAQLGIEVKRLRGYLWRESITGDITLPVGDAEWVYSWSLRHLARARKAVDSSEP